MKALVHKAQVLVIVDVNVRRHQVEPVFSTSRLLIRGQLVLHIVCVGIGGRGKPHPVGCTERTGRLVKGSDRAHLRVRAAVTFLLYLAMCSWVMDRISCRLGAIVLILIQWMYFALSQAVHCVLSRVVIATSCKQARRRT